MRDYTYPTVVMAAKTMFKVLGQKITIMGEENIPLEGGALLTFNHVGYIDFVYGGLAAQPRNKRLVRFMAKKEIFDHPVGGPIMRSLHHIPVDRGDGIGSFHHAVDYLRKGELVGIFPEATISRAMEVKDLKNGAVRIAQEAGVPIIPVALWGTQRLLPKGQKRDLTRGRSIHIKVGAPFMPTGKDANDETLRLHDALSALVDETIQGFPADEQPAGSWWLPAKFGGGAPTLEEAKVLEQEERRERARRKAEKARAKAGGKKK